MEIPFSGKFGPKKIKIVTLSWNLVPTPIRACRIQWWISFFLFLSGNIFSGQIWSKNVKSISWNWNLVARLIRICWIQWCCKLFSFFTGSAVFWKVWSKLSIFTVFFLFPIRNALFWEKFCPKCQSCQFKAKFASYNLLQNIFGI